MKHAVALVVAPTLALSLPMVAPAHAGPVVKFPPMLGQPIVEDFEDGQIDGQWQWSGTGFHMIPPTGGHPGAYVTKTLNQSPSVSIRTYATKSSFLGDYRARGVTSLGIDLKTFLTSDQGFVPDNPFVWDFELVFGVANDAGTPFDLLDDTLYYFPTGQLPPFVGEDWTSFDVLIPSQADELLPGWIFYDNPFLPPVPNPLPWREVMQDVSYVYIQYGYPELIYIIGNWTCGADNIRITFRPNDPADLDGDGDVDGLDLALMLGQWTGPALYSPCPPAQPADLNEDCKVNGLDIALLLGAWAP